MWDWYCNGLGIDHQHNYVNQLFKIEHRLNNVYMFNMIVQSKLIFITTIREAVHGHITRVYWSCISMEMKYAILRTPLVNERNFIFKCEPHTTHNHN